MTLTVLRAIGSITVQDLGRPGHMHQALAPGGALVPELLVAANRAAENPDSAAALEVSGRLVVTADSDVIVAIDRPHLLRAGESFELVSEPRRVAYLAVRGGIAAPVILGSRSTQLSAGIGALVRPGDRISPEGQETVLETEGETVLETVSDPRNVGIVPGPDRFADGALEVLVGAAYRILPSSDRIGTQLAGPALGWAAGHDQVSRPLVRGAIEVTAGGMPIVMGPEHPTTGGYPVIAVIAHADLGRFFSMRLGGTVRFEIRPGRGS